MRWFGRLGLHLVAAVGATGIFVAAAAVGANQARPENPAVVEPATSPPQTRTPVVPRRAAAATAVRPERSLAGTVREVQADAVVIQNLRGQEWRVTPAPGALLRLNGKATKLEAIQPGDRVVVLGQAQSRANFTAHAITARRK
jgi:hypothetical protein